MPYREQIGGGNVPRTGGPSGGPVGDLEPPAQPTLDGGPAARAAAEAAPEPPAARPRAVPGETAIDDAKPARREDAAAQQRAAEAAAQARREAQRPRIGDLIPADGPKVSAEERSRVKDEFFKVIAGKYAGLTVKPDAIAINRSNEQDWVIVSGEIRNSAGEEVGFF
ncbi:hypothetical protein GCM10009530_35820 [Microbispora corallina]|uniref:Uncharacterized protein n=1 Tax=Microbispora corallina TaxID=83302 RepID=A0ABQ4FYJ0_9ACTN|nr:hypothetical protein [Microbispora corallina]GIH39882.1 hypothetical protein Mco01_28820 [Microbispora corallina]